MHAHTKHINTMDSRFMQIERVCVSFRMRRDETAKQQSFVHRIITIRHGTNAIHSCPYSSIYSLSLLLFLRQLDRMNIQAIAHKSERLNSHFLCGFASFLAAVLFPINSQKRRQSATQTVKCKTKSFRHFSYKTNCETCDDTCATHPLALGLIRTRNVAFSIQWQHSRTT